MFDGKAVDGDSQFRLELGEGIVVWDQDGLLQVSAEIGGELVGIVNILESIDLPGPKTYHCVCETLVVVEQRCKITKTGILRDCCEEVLGLYEDKRHKKNSPVG